MKQSKKKIILSFPVWGGLLFLFLSDLSSTRSTGNFLAYLYIILTLCSSQPILTNTKTRSSSKLLTAIGYYAALLPICFIFLWGMVGMA